MSIGRSLVALVLSVTATSLVGCSSPSPETSDPAATPAAEAAAKSAPEPSDALLPHGCDLLTAADAEAVLGPGAKLTRNSVVSCILETPKPIGPAIEVKIDELPDTWDGGEMMMEFDKEARKVEGIGEGAYTFGGGTIVFKKGKAEVMVITSAYKGDMSKFDAAKLIAEKLVAKM